MTFRHEAFLTLVAVLAALGLAGCGSAESPKDVVLVTHDSFVVSKSVREEFERESDYLNTYEPRRCKCGCGQQVLGRRTYINASHKQRAYRARLNAADGATGR